MEVSNKKQKKNKGQFYTTNNNYILDGIEIPSHIQNIVEPFAGKGDLIDWVKSKTSLHVVSYDIEPKRNDIIERDTLLNPPNYDNYWIITNPPYLARNKSTNKELYDIYNTNDLYKCFIKSFVNYNCLGGIIIIPAGFFFSPRDIDVECRHQFMRKYKIIKIKYFEETVFEDTTTTVVVILFELSDEIMNEQNVPWVLMPSSQEKIFQMTEANDWIIGGEIYNLPSSKTFKIARYVEGKKLKNNEYQTFMTLNALDSGKKNGRISLNYKHDYIYPSKDCSRTYATITTIGIELSEDEQINICNKFNTYIEEKRQEYWSMFLPQYRESKEYARKRIPFELVYQIILNIILGNIQ